MKILEDNGDVRLYRLDGVSIIDMIVHSDVSDKDLIWLDSSTRGDLPQYRVKNRDKFYLILTRILLKDSRRPRNRPKGYYLNISNAEFARYVPNKNDISVIKRLLEASGVIDIHRKSSSGGGQYTRFSQGYRINSKYLHHHKVPVYNEPSEYFRFTKKTRDNWSGHIKSKAIAPEPVSIHAYDVQDKSRVEEDNDLFVWLRECHRKVEVDVDKATGILDEYLQHPDEEVRIDKDSYDRSETRIDGIRNFKRANYSTEIFARLVSIRRLNSNIGLFDKKLLPALSYKNQPIKWVDVQACHPFLLLALYKKYAGNDDVEKEKEKYRMLWASGCKDFYTNFSLLADKQEPRSKLKQKFLGKEGLYSRHRQKRLSYIQRVYRDNFPILYGIISNIKTTKYLDKDDHFWKTYATRLAAKVKDTKDKNKISGSYTPPPKDILFSQLAYVVLRMEADVIIDKACRRLLEVNGKDCFAVTRHDCIGVQASKVKEVKKYIREAFVDVTGYRCYF